MLISLHRSTTSVAVSYAESQMQSGPTRRTVGPLSVRTAGRIRTYDRQIRQNAALSAELQRYAERNLSQLLNTDLGFLLSCG